MNLEEVRWRGFSGAERVVEWVARIDVVTLKRIVVLGMLLRVALLLVSSGSNDILTWEKFGREIAARGVLEEYQRNVKFNHPPLMGLWGRTAVWIADHTVVPFRITFKLLPLAADVLGLWLIYALAKKHAGDLHAWRAAAVFSTSLLSIIITSHHGNTDSVCGVLILAAVALMADGRRPFVAGLAFAAALNVKLIPLAVLPAVALLLPDVRTMVRFGAGLALGLTPFLPPVLYVWEAFYRNAIAYQPRTPWWGIHFVLSWGFALPGVGPWLQFIDVEYDTHARHVILAASFGLGVWGRWAKRSAIEVAALALAMFLVLTPGIGLQYMVMLVPVLVMTDLRRAAIWGFVAGVFGSWLYVHFGSQWFPFQSRMRQRTPGPIIFVGFVAWLVLLEIMWSRLRWKPRLSAVLEKDQQELSRMNPG
jgi:Glycosyltransferase family 87